MMGQMIEEHTDQIKSIERRENIVKEQESEMKKFKETYYLDQEKFRIQSINL